ncbi:hypothetical protein [Thioflexithrix psekupsensis]|uniref:Uncharacterized protein n=1 Tax=Thioflexithrix psekupsensis TaxID=1570016 RepID=A0A251X439_9GAMM|nr:hypothetical protein [Thioflexithrix psekupsensis]OUD11640.1 hypothetical protein TPSD3_16415 [Thioflexithrix psekupsensis]
MIKNVIQQLGFALLIIGLFTLVISGFLVIALFAFILLVLALIGDHLISLKKTQISSDDAFIDSSTAAQRNCK